MAVALFFGGVILAAVVSYSIFVLYKKSQTQKMLANSGYKTFPEVPILGSISLVPRVSKSEGLFEFLREEFLEDPEIKGGIVRFGHILMVFITELEHIEEVVLHPEHSDKSHLYGLANFFTPGIVTAKGEVWKKLRKGINPSFSQKMMDSYLNDMNQTLSIFMELMKENEDRFIDLRRYVQLLLFDSIAKTHFNTETDEQQNPVCLFTERFGRCVQTIFEERGVKFHMHWDVIYKLTSSYRRIIDTLNPVWQFISKIVEVSLEREDKMTVLEGEHQEKFCYPPKVAIALEEVGIKPTLWNIMLYGYDLFFAGSETSTVVLCTLIYNLALHPEEQEKLYEEAVKVYGSERFRPLTKADLAILVRTEMAIKEAARLSSPPHTGRDMVNDFKVGDHVLPKGCTVYCLLKAVHRNPKYWERPNEFWPDHFLPEQVEKRPKRAFFGFSHGPRNCPGAVYAYQVGKMFVSAIMRNYRVETNLPPDQVKHKTVLMEDHVDDYPIKFIPR